MAGTRTLTPLRGIGIRLLSRGPGYQGTGKPAGIDWASCNTGAKSAFRRTPQLGRGNGFYLAPEDLGLIGLGLAAFTPLAFAYVGPASAYFITGPGGLLYSSTSVGQALLASGAAGGLAGLIRPKGAEFVNMQRPCSETVGVKF